MGYTKLKVGITTIIALGFLFGGVFWVKSYNPLKKKVTMVVAFEDGQSITGGDPVQLSGIKVGEVTGVSLSEDNLALVKFYMDETKLSPDTWFTISDVGLMGDKALLIFPGSAPGELNPTVIHHGTPRADLSTLTVSAGEVLKRLESIAADIDENLQMRSLAAAFDSTLDKFNEAITLYRDLAAESRKPLTTSLTNLEEVSSDMKDFVERNDTRLEQAITSFQRTADDMSSFLDSIKNLPVVVDTLAYYVGSGEGTLGLLVKSDDLYQELRETNAHIDSFVVDFKRNPEKYTKDMQFKLRLF
ncbi:MlaD family protein [Candidatus Latescibacterota bacterium]